LSNRFYEIIPSTRYKESATPSINSKWTLNEKLRLLNNLLDIEVVSKMLLGAHYNFYDTHPLDYVYNSLNVRFLPLQKDDPEH